MSILDIGHPAPDFTLSTNGNGEISLSDLKGKKVVVYFYPKDNTPGCTNEAIDFSSMKSQFDDANVEIIGISKDSVKKHDNFVAKHDLKITLGADEDGKVCEAYGVWAEKSLYGKKYMGIQRATFLINEKGCITYIWPKVKVKGHAEDVLSVVNS